MAPKADEDVRGRACTVTWSGQIMKLLGQIKSWWWGGDRYENWKKKVKVTVKSWITLSLSIQIHFQFRDSQKTTLYKKDTLATDDTYDNDDSDDSDNGACKWGPKVGRCSPRSAQVSCKLHAQIIEALWIPNHHQCLQNLPRKHVTISDITILEIAVYMNDYDSILII